MLQALLSLFPFSKSERAKNGGGWGEEIFCPRAWKPRRTARILGGRNRAEISLSFFEFFSGGARKRKIVRENFCEVAAGALAEAGGGAGQFASKKVRAKDIISPPIFLQEAAQRRFLMCWPNYAKRSSNLNMAFRSSQVVSCLKGGRQNG